ncbi:MAG TPA: hypothetical protein VKZ18_27435 [Polyangia bacterium]|nr:hypothetical protein [Polyangia bacterium]
MTSPDCAPRDAVDQIEISSPCTVAWDEMRRTAGDERVRFCGQCRQNVYNVEAMGRGEARRLIAAREGRVCVRILRRPDGTVVTADCWARLRAARRRGWLPFLGMLVLVSFTQLIAVGTGLGRLRSLFAGPPPVPPARISLPVIGAPPALPPRASDPHEMGGKGPARLGELKGKLAVPPPPRQTGHYFMGAPPPRYKMGEVAAPSRVMGRMPPQ